MREKKLKDKSVKNKKTIRVVWAVVLAIISFIGGGLATWFSLEPEFRSLIKTKKAIDNFYYEDVDDSEFFGVIFDAINGEILDEYSRYMTADEFQSFTTEGEGKRSGLGLVFLTKDVEGASQMRITRVCGNSPAEKAGVKTGNYVVGFGDSATNITESVVFEEFAAFLEDYEAQENFYIKIKDGMAADSPTRVVELAKEAYVENYVFYRTATTAYRFEGNKALTMVEKGELLACLGDLDAKTAYIRLTEFNGAATGEFQQAMSQFRKDGMQNLVLDLRGNGGGYLNIMQDIAAYFSKDTKAKNPLAVVADYGEYKQGFRANGNYYWDYFNEDSRICVLADSESASASECLIGFMVDYGAISYGDICLTERNGVAKTFGKGIMQTTIPLIFGGDAVKLTSAVIRWPISNHCIHGRGVLPEDGALVVAETGDFDSEIAASVAKLFS